MIVPGPDRRDRRARPPRAADRDAQGRLDAHPSGRRRRRARVRDRPRLLPGAPRPRDRARRRRRRGVARSTTCGRARSSRRRRPSSRRSSAASRPPTAGRSSSASATPRTSSRSPDASDRRATRDPRRLAPSPSRCSRPALVAVSATAATAEASVHGGRQRARRRASCSSSRTCRRAGRPRRAAAAAPASPVRRFDPDQSDLTTIGHAESGFENADGLGNIASITGIFASSSQAQTSWNRLVRPALLGCMARFVESSATKGTTIKVTSKGKLSLAVPGEAEVGLPDRRQRDRGQRAGQGLPRPDPPGRRPGRHRADHHVRRPGAVAGVRGEAREGDRRPPAEVAR